uniref:Uncharacterized protein n=1 Tax=Caenorhabditis japonica TaxID=281687 RepID=A0A8R1HQ77_CAEJA
MASPPSASSSSDPIPPPTPTDMLMVNDHVVGCEVEIDGFDVQYEGSQEYGHDPDPAGYYQYEEDDDPGTVYLFDEDTSQIHQIPSHHMIDTAVDEQEIDVEYVEEASQPSTSSTSSAPIPTVPPNTYLIRKNGEYGKQPTYSQISFHTTYTQSMNRRGRRVIKRTHVPLTGDEMESMIEDSQVMKRIQTEISALRKENDTMKKEYEKVHRRLDGITMAMNEAKQKNRETIEEKKQLIRELALARNTNIQLVKRIIPEPKFGFE